jgi:CheY-like chemotaxis protein
MVTRPERPVLIVEDDPDIRDATAILLEDEGYRVAQAENGLKALEVITRGPAPSLVLLDLMMPVMDGQEFLQRLKALGPPRADLPVVVMTAAHNPSVPEAKQVIRKPYSVDVLLEAVARFADYAAP